MEEKNEKHNFYKIISFGIVVGFELRIGGGADGFEILGLVGAR